MVWREKQILDRRGRQVLVSNIFCQKYIHFGFKEIFPQRKLDTLRI